VLLPDLTLLSCDLFSREIQCALMFFFGGLGFLEKAFDPKRHDVVVALERRRQLILIFLHHFWDKATTSAVLPRAFDWARGDRQPAGRGGDSPQPP
jgi:hypothetical protein